MDSLINSIKFDEKGLVPVVTQEEKTNEVLMVAYMNQEAFTKTMETGKVHYWSRSRKKLWLKGENSGHFQYVKSIKIDCDGDTLLIKVEQIDSACHTGNHSCFYRDINIEAASKNSSDVNSKVAFKDEKVYNKAYVLQELYDVISDRAINPKEGSYTNYLFQKGIDKILKKVGEETAEVIIAAKNNVKDEIRYEIADLFYHLFVLMVERKVAPDDIYDELKKRQ